MLKKVPEDGQQLRLEYVGALINIRIQAQCNKLVLNFTYVM
jgi:hypothetical protein